MLKLKLQYFGYLIRRNNSLEKTLILGKTEGKRRSRQQRMRWQDSITDSMDLRDREGQGSLDPSCSSNKGLWARFFKLPSYPGKPLALSQVCCPSGPPWSLLDPFTFTVLGTWQTLSTQRFSLQFWTFLLHYFFDNSFIFIFSILSLCNLFWLRLNLLDEFSVYLFPLIFHFFLWESSFSFSFQFLFQIFLVLLSYF